MDGIKSALDISSLSQFGKNPANRYTLVSKGSVNKETYQLMFIRTHSCVPALVFAGACNSLIYPSEWRKTIHYAIIWKASALFTGYFTIALDKCWSIMLHERQRRWNTLNLAAALHLQWLCAWAPGLKHPGDSINFSHVESKFERASLILNACPT